MVVWSAKEILPVGMIGAGVMILLVFAAAMPYLIRHPREILSEMEG